MNDDDESERGPEGCHHIVRNVSEDALFIKQDRNAKWTAYNCFDENQGTELLWLKVECTDSDDSDGIRITDVFEHLQAWKNLDHSMLLRIESLWLSPGDDKAGGACINFVAEMCGRTSLRTYRQLHTRLGFPAIQKISRQLFKALLHISEHSQLPVNKVTAVDVQVHPVNAKLCVLPTFIWRAPDAPPDAAPPDAADSGSARLRCMLHTFVALMVELFSGAPFSGASAERLRQELVRVDLPNDDVRHVLLTCLPEPEQRLPSVHELLESPLLDPRRFWNVTAPPPDTAPGPPDAPDDAPLVHMRSLDRRFSTIGMAPKTAAGPAPRVASAGAVAAVAAAAIAEIDQEANFTLGRVKGLDYIVSVNGSLSGRLIDFTIKLEQQTGATSEAAKPAAHLVRFPFDLNVDVVDGVVDELAPLFSMEETDRDLTAAAMKEVIASLVPEMEHLYSSASRMSYDGGTEELPSPSGEPADAGPVSRPLPDDAVAPPGAAPASGEFGVARGGEQQPG